MDAKAKEEDLAEFLASVTGDLSNITAPPFLLAPLSVTEVGSCWTERPLLLAAPSQEPDPARRAMLILKWFLASLKSQFYMGSTPGGGGLRKPLNAFLGEIFVGSWTQEVETRGRSRSRGQSLSMPGPNGGVLDANGWEQPRGFVRKATTRLVAEQVSHHPPVTAVYMEDDEHGIRGEGYARVEMMCAEPTSVEIRQVGHAVLQIDRFDEAYLIPLPDARVHGIPHTNPCPDIDGTYRIASSSGYVSEIDFTGGKERHTFEARVFNADETEEEEKEPTPLYRVSGKWSDSFMIRDCRTDRVVDRYDTNAYYHTPADLRLPPLEEQDPWEAHKAWRAVMEAIRRDDYTAIMEEKSRLEEAQRDMRRREKENGERWQPLLFRSSMAEDGDDDEEPYAGLQALDPSRNWKAQTEKTRGVWRADLDRIKALRRPFRGRLTPLG